MSRTRKYATTTEAAIRALAEQGLTNNQIAEKLNVAPGALSIVRGMLGIAAVKKRDVFAVKAWWLPAMAAGATVETISKAEGVSYPTVYGALRKAGLPTTRKDAAEYMADTNKAPAAETANPLSLVA